MSTAEPQVSRTATVATILRDEILSGQYRAGERLPSERDLCERFSVSRGAVREALKQLQQLGIAAIQPGGARVVAVEECTLGVLGPLLDLTEQRDPKLVDEAMHMIGVLLREAATAAIEKATNEELAAAEAIIDEVLASSGDHVRQFEAIRRLADFYVDVADHLVLRLMINGMRATFFTRLGDLDPLEQMSPEEIARPIERIQSGLIERNPEELGAGMHELSQVFREGARTALQGASGSAQTELK